MNILIRNNDDVVIAADPIILLDETQARGSDWIDYNFTSVNARIEEVEELPKHWCGAVWSYIDETWTIVDQVRHAEVVARAQALANPVPLEITRRQGLQALRIKKGLTLTMLQAKIGELIADPMTRDLALIELETSSTFERYRPLVVNIGTAIGLDLDELFRYAKTL